MQTANSRPVQITVATQVGVIPMPTEADGFTPEEIKRIRIGRARRIANGTQYVGDDYYGLDAQDARFAGPQPTDDELTLVRY